MLSVVMDASSKQPWATAESKVYFTDRESIFCMNEGFEDLPVKFYKIFTTGT